jgi:nicotinate-nucleotide adenylyltransferase
MQIEPHSLLPGAAPRFGILGGTFDPPHIAHLVVGQEVLARLPLDRVYFMPAGQPPHKRGHAISPAADRLAMIRLAIADHPGFAVSTVELDRQGPSYTVDTLRQLRTTWGRHVGLFLIIGWDMLADLPRWYDPAGVVAESTGIVAVHRPGYQADTAVLNRVAAELPALPEKLILLPAPQLEISASELRERVASSLPIRYLVPDTVIQHIRDHGLYRDAASARGATPACDTGRKPLVDSQSIHPNRPSSQEAQP